MKEKILRDGLMSHKTKGFYPTNWKMPTELAWMGKAISFPFNVRAVHFPCFLFLSFFLCSISLGQVTVQDWKEEAMEKHRDLQVKESPFYKRFVDLWQTTRRKNPGLLEKPNWPMILADRVAQEERENPSPGTGDKERKTKSSDEQALQRARAVGPEISEKLGINLQTKESDYFVIHSDAPVGERQAALRTGEKVYRKLNREVCDIIPIGDDAVLRSGKFVILLFKNRQEYTDFWYKVRGATGELSGSMGAGFGDGVRGFVASTKPGRTRDLTWEFYFYVSPLFLNEYLEGKRVPAWVRMSFNYYCGNVVREGQSGARNARNRVKQAVERGNRRTFQAIRESKGFPVSDKDGRMFCFSLLDYMLSIDEEKYIAFLDRLKLGTDQVAALEDVYGMTAAEFEEGWFRHIDRY
jgi:hypothetical protein